MSNERPALIGLDSLNPPQREAVEHVHGPLLVVAGAGSGKTRVLTMRIARLIDQAGVPPSRIFAVTFTNKAAGEMKERVGRLLGQDPSGLWIGTFHSLSARLLRREAEALGFTRQFTIFDEDDRLALVKRLMEQRGHSTKLFPPRMIQALVSAAKNRMTGPDELANAAPFDRPAQVAADVYRGLGPALKSQNAMDFDDLMLHPLTLFGQRPDRLAYYQERFAFLLVDEFQDTNTAQYRLVTLLGRHGNVCAVGDDDQSIYGWRGADVRNMQSFQQDFPGTKLVRLEDNYRSTQIVLDAANAVIEENKGRIGKTLRTRRKGGEPVTVVATADERDEAEWIVKEFRTRSAKGDWEYREMAVLYRTNAQSRAMEEAFRRAGIPYRIVGAISFYDRREVKDLLAYLRLIANPADDEAFLRAIAVPRRGLGESSLATVQETAARWGKSLLETARGADMIQGARPNVREALRKFAQLIDDLRERAVSWPPAQILEQLIQAIDYEQVLTAEGPEGVERWENVRELVASAAEWSEVVEPAEDDPTTPLERFLSEAALLSANDAAHRQGPGVAGGGPERPRGRALPPGPRRGAGERARRGTPALLRRHHTGQGQAVPQLGPGSAAGRGTAAWPSLPLSAGAAAGGDRGEADEQPVGAGLGWRGDPVAGRLTRSGGAGPPTAFGRLFRAAEPPNRRVDRGLLPGLSALCERRARAPPPLRQWDDPGPHGNGQESEGLSQV